MTNKYTSPRRIAIMQELKERQKLQCGVEGMLYTEDEWDAWNAKYTRETHLATQEEDLVALGNTMQAAQEMVYQKLQELIDAVVKQ